MCNIKTIQRFLLLFCTMTNMDALIKLEKNGYTGILVSIDDKIAEDMKLLCTIKNWLTEASEKLYKASKYHVFLKEIIIRVPVTWKNYGQYNVITSSIVENADVIVEEPKPNVRSNPHVFGLPGCGMKGRYMHFTTDVLFKGNSGKFGNLGTVFVHEWGHLRWGIYDEYPTLIYTNTGDRVKFYLENGNYEPVRCTKQVTGKRYNFKDRRNCKLDNYGRPEVNCDFSASSGAKASMMGHAYVSTITHFCDNDTNDISTLHNEKAPNKQNYLCDSKSAWEIIRENSDFNSANTSPGSPFASTQPKFILEQLRIERRFCLAIDVSGSMEDYIQSARAALSTIIKNVIPNDSYVGVVKFSNGASLVKALTRIVSDSDRDDIVSRLPTTTGGYTSIGAGLRRCTEALSTLNNVNGSKIYLATDGEENAAPYIADVLPNIIGKGIILDTLAISDSADSKLQDISTSTGGNSYFYSPLSKNSTALVDALMEPFTQTSNDPLIRIQSLSIEQPMNTVFTTQFFIDESIGRETVITLTADVSSNVNLTVTHSKNTYTVVGDQQNLGLISVKIPGKAEVGKYNVTVTSSNTMLTGTLSIISKAATPGEDVLQLKVLTTQSDVEYSPVVRFPLFVSVYRGIAPVINTVVTAIIENENGHTSTLLLKDNEIGADAIANDGIYSGYVLPTHIAANGRHNIKITAEGLDSKVIVFTTSRSPGNDFDEEILKEETIDPFMRVTLANEIVVREYVEPVNDQDLIPPSPILTLRLINTNPENNTFTIGWRAVGDDYDTGIVSFYDIRYSTNRASLKTNPNNQPMLPSNLQPKDPGEEESLVFQIPDIQVNTTYFVTVRAVDEHNNTGELSNFAAVSVLSDRSWLVEDEQHLQGLIIEIVASIAVASVAILAIFILACILFWKRRKRQESLNGAV